MRDGYRRSITGLYRVMCRMNIYKKTPSKKKEYVPKPYEEVKYQGERVQVDVKYVSRKYNIKRSILSIYSDR